VQTQRCHAKEDEKCGSLGRARWSVKLIKRSRVRVNNYYSTRELMRLGPLKPSRFAEGIQYTGSGFSILQL
jgi:hypothetical protein